MIQQVAAVRRAKSQGLTLDGDCEFIHVPDNKWPFDAKKKFVIDVGRSAKLPIETICTDFRGDFLYGGFVVEQPAHGYCVNIHPLRSQASAEDLLTELGGEHAAEMDLFAGYHAMRQQAFGGPGKLAVDGKNNIMFTRNRFGVLRCVSFFFRDMGWNLRSMNIESTILFDTNDRMLIPHGRIRLHHN